MVQIQNDNAVNVHVNGLVRNDDLFVVPVLVSEYVQTYISYTKPCVPLHQEDGCIVNKGIIFHKLNDVNTEWFFVSVGNQVHNSVFFVDLDFFDVVDFVHFVDVYFLIRF